MSENQNRGIRDFTKYDSMATEELEAILRSDTETPAGQESDGELLLYVMGVLAQRKQNSSNPGKTAQEAYESFKQHYMPERDNPSQVSVKAKSVCPRWFRSLTAAAAVLAVLLIGSVTAKAFGIDIWRVVIQWTQETFHFGQWGNSNPNNTLSYSSFQEALEKGNTPAWLVPTWIPDGYEIVDITAEQSPLKKKYTAIYTKSEQILKITVRDYLDKGPVYVEQSEDLAEEYTVSGITYYLFDNNGQVQAIWIVDSYECCISGEMTIDTLKLMIDSIEEG